MSAAAEPRITLEDAKKLVELLENGEQEQADQLVHSISNGDEENELFAEVGKLTRQLHDSLKNFQLDTRISELTSEAIPDAKERLSYVMSKTEDAANRTMDAVEASLPLADKLGEDVNKIKPTWDRLMSRDLKVGEFKLLCHDVDSFIRETQNNTSQLHTLLNEVLMAQDFQDLTGQVIRRVIELVVEVEDSLIHLLTAFGSPPEGAAKEQKEEQPTTVAEDTVAEGPIIDSDKRDDVVSGQDEVDDLLSSLGF